MDAVRPARPGPEDQVAADDWNSQGTKGCFDPQISYNWEDQASVNIWNWLPDRYQTGFWKSKAVSISTNIEEYLIKGVKLLSERFESLQYWLRQFCR